MAKELIQAIEEKVASGAIVCRDDLENWIETGDIETWGTVAWLIKGWPHLVEASVSQQTIADFLVEYYRRCIVESPNNDYSDSRYTAAHALAAWYKALRKTVHENHKLLGTLRKVLEDLYLCPDEKVRLAVVHGVLEHVFEDPDCIPDFQGWKHTAVLRSAYEEAIQWARRTSDKCGDV
jgi:hypothetical protein